MSQDVIEKVRKLLALAERGGTPEEAATAAAMAAQIALKHNLDLNLIQKASHAAKPGVTTRVILTEGSKFEQWINNIVDGVCTLNACKHYFTPFAEVEYSAVGRPDQLAVVEATVGYLVQATNRFNRLAISGRGLDKDGRKRFRDSFRLTCSQVLRQRLIEMYRDLTQNEATAQKATGSTALVVLNHYEQEMKEVTEWMDQSMKIKTSRHKVKSITDRDGQLAGYEAGKKINLANQVGAEPQKPRLR